MVEVAISEEEVPVETGEQLQLTVEERELIEQAVSAAERGTNAEIVPMIVARSGLYRDTQHRVGLVFAMVVLTLLLTCERMWLPWGWHASDASWLVLSMVIGYGIGVWVGTFSPVIRLLTSAERMHHKVTLRAQRAFARHAVSQTRERTGVLIMVSLLERQIYILPDQPLFQRIPVEQWSRVVETAVDRLRMGDIVGGLCQAIETCGVLLKDVCPGRPGDNPDELSNKLLQEP